LPSFDTNVYREQCSLYYSILLHCVHFSLKVVFGCEVRTVVNVSSKALNSIYHTICISLGNKGGAGARHSQTYPLVRESCRGASESRSLKSNESTRITTTTALTTTTMTYFSSLSCYISLWIAYHTGTYTRQRTFKPV